jgi:dephospho-CoA kinase
MSIYYIAGVSGSGKSSLVEKLKENGYKAYDADSELCSWFDSKGNAVEYPRDAAERTNDWHDNHKFLMSEQEVQKLAAKDVDSYIFGITPNDLELADKYFAKVLFLHIPEEEMMRRVSTRTNNEYGHDADQLAHMQKWYKPTVDKYKNYGATFIDATVPIENVYKEVLRLTNS